MENRPGSPESNPAIQADSPALVFVVDDDASMRESLALLIASAGWRAELFASAHDFFARPRIRVPSCLILDVRLPDICGLELQERVADDRDALPIVFVAEYGDVPTAVRAMKAGAVDFLTKPCPEDALLAAISCAIERSRSTLRKQGEVRIVRERYATLTPREREVMALVTAGLLNKQVGAELGISEITVKAHRGKVMRKMRVRSLAWLVDVAVRLGVQPSIRQRTASWTDQDFPSAHVRSNAMSSFNATRAATT
jgi:FixJ family two-component response regulator